MRRNELLPQDWHESRRSLAGTGLQLLLCSPGIAFVPVIGLPLALVVALAGLVTLVSFQVLLSGPCPFCASGQTIVVPMDGISWRQVRERRTGRVVGADCTVCGNRMIVQVDRRAAVAAPRVVVRVG
ncbi:MAG: hypothetical protein FJ148_15850 [Deltaproteobacteria bacterium]|nr:hypothetical protein [Deltaproteobacteria bacterium]MBM4269152.1 hypothetical protein [Deltaproteobacteria bacterium]